MGPVHTVATGGRPPARHLPDERDDGPERVAVRRGAQFPVQSGRAVLLGEPAIPRPLVAVLMNRLRGDDAKRHLMVPDGRGVDLTGREWEVLDCMREGLSTREIAGKLLIADVTVRRHIGAVLKKLQVQSRREALELLRSA